jgi:hypothetical protein
MAGVPVYSRMLRYGGWRCAALRRQQREVAVTDYRKLFDLTGTRWKTIAEASWLCEV